MIKKILAALLISSMLFTTVSCNGSTPAETKGEGEKATESVTETEIVTESEKATESVTEAETESATESESETESATETEKETETESENTAETEKETESATEADDTTETVPATAAEVPDVFFGFYNVRTPASDKSELMNLEKSDKINCIITGADNKREFIDIMETAIEYDNYFWVYCTFLEGTVVDGERQLKSGWKRRMEKIVEQIESAGAYDRFLGWYMDEPLLNKYSLDSVYEVTKYNHDTFGKRFFICFTVEAVAPEVYSDGVIRKQISRETSTYITDAAYDMYWDYSKSNMPKYKRVNKKLREAMPEDCKIWYIPWTYAEGSGKIEDNAEKNERIRLEHLNAMYEFLKAEENPGGLYCFLYRGKSSNFYGMQEYVDAGYWKDIYARALEIGSEIVSGNIEGNEK